MKERFELYHGITVFNILGNGLSRLCIFVCKFQSKESAVFFQTLVTLQIIFTHKTQSTNTLYRRVLLCIFITVESLLLSMWTAHIEMSKCLITKKQFY